MSIRGRGIVAAVGFLIVMGAQTVFAGNPIEQEVRAGLLDRINRDRERHGLAPVLLDEQSSRIADAYCSVQVETGTRGHFSTDGLSPYMRYSFAGIHDAVLENAAAWTAKEVVPDDLINRLAQKSHSEMIAEIPPADGHRRAILDPHVTHVGIGVSWGGREVRIVEALLRRYLGWESTRQKMTEGESARFVARVLDPRATTVESVSVHYEPFPYRLTRERANMIDTYGLPPELLRYERARPSSPLDAASRNRAMVPAFELRGDLLSFDLVPSSGRGIYTIVVWARRPGDARPFAATNLAVVVDAAGDRVSTGIKAVPSGTSSATTSVISKERLRRD